MKLKLRLLPVATCVIAACITHPFPPAPDATVEIGGWFRYYMLHSSYGELSRIDAAWLSGGVYSFKKRPGPHLVQLRMSQASAMNPLIFGGGVCAVVLDTQPNRRYKFRPPSLKDYGRFWTRPPLGKLLAPPAKRFHSHISVEVSGASLADEHIQVPMDCQSRTPYCRVVSDCEPSTTDAPATAEPECIYRENFPVGTCSQAQPVHNQYN